MAKIKSLLIGQGTGSVGNQVIYQAGGSTIVRAKAQSVKNPRSAQQSVQRAILASASKLTALMRPYVNHSTQGVATGNDSVHAFQKRAMAAFRAGALATINNGDKVLAHYNLKGGLGVPFVNGLLVSKGTLVGPSVSSIARGLRVIYDENLLDLTQPINTQEGYENALRLLFGARPGDQISIFFLCDDVRVETAVFGNEVDFNGFVLASRFTFVKELPAGFNAILVNNSVFNPALIEESEGSENVYINYNADIPALEFFYPADNSTYYKAGCIVRSQKQDNGTFKYSAAPLLAVETESSNILAAYPSYMTTAERAEVGEQLFLQNAESEAPTAAQQAISVVSVEDDDAQIQMQDGTILITGTGGAQASVTLSEAIGLNDASTSDESTVDATRAEDNDRVVKLQLGNLEEGTTSKSGIVNLIVRGVNIAAIAYTITG